MKWFRSRGWGFWCGAWAIGVTVAGAGTFIAFWVQPNTGESLSSTIRNIGLTSAAAIALPLAFWRSTTADSQSDTALKQSATALSLADAALRQADAALRQADTTSQGLLNERYQKGAEMLGSSVLPVRLGGIYALRRLAEEHPGDYHIQIMRLFCAFVRHPTVPNHGYRSPVALDVQEAINAIGYRSQAGLEIERDAKYMLDLSAANLVEARLEEADLSGAMLDRADLGGASVAGIDLTDASLDGAVFSYENNDIPIYRAIFDKADLTDANLSGVHLVNVDLTRALLDRGNLSGAQLIRTKMAAASLTGTNLTGAIFTDVDGLDQRELSRTDVDENNPPTFIGCVDARTGEELVWQP